MAEQTTTPLQTVPDTEEEVVKQSRFKDFASNHPRITKIAGISAAVAGAVAAVALVKKSKQDAPDYVINVYAPADVADLDPTTETPESVGA